MFAFARAVCFCCSSPKLLLSLSLLLVSFSLMCYVCVCSSSMVLLLESYVVAVLFTNVLITFAFAPAICFFVGVL